MANSQAITTWNCEGDYFIFFSGLLQNMCSAFFMSNIFHTILCWRLNWLKKGSFCHDFAYSAPVLTYQIRGSLELRPLLKSALLLTVFAEVHPPYYVQHLSRRTSWTSPGHSPKNISNTLIKKNNNLDLCVNRFFLFCPPKTSSKPILFKIWKLTYSKIYNVYSIKVFYKLLFKFE